MLRWIVALALLALGLALLAPPVFAQVSVVNQNADQVGLVNDSVCSQVYNAAVQQYNAGDQNANAGAGAVADAAAGQYGEANAAAIAGANATNIANVTGIDIGTVNACLNRVGTNDTSDKDTNDVDADGKDRNNDIVGSDDKDKFAVAAVEQYGNDDVIIKSIPDQKVLADTGGPIILLPALGLLLVTVGATMLRVLLRR